MTKIPDATIDLETRFRLLAEKWREETGLIPDSERAATHPALLEIIRMGMPVVPLLLRDMEKDHSHWFKALRAITGVNPVPPEHRGRVAEMVGDWVTWGKGQGLL